MLEVCVVGLAADVMVAAEVSVRGSVVDVTTTMVEVGTSCEVGFVSVVIMVGTEGADSVEDVTTTTFEVGICCEVGIVSEVIIVGTEGTDWV